LNGTAPFGRKTWTHRHLPNVLHLALQSGDLARALVTPVIS
jgi:hypothetical protein